MADVRLDSFIVGGLGSAAAVNAQADDDGLAGFIVGVSPGLPEQDPAAANSAFRTDLGGPPTTSSTPRTDPGCGCRIVVVGGAEFVVGGWTEYELGRRREARRARAASRARRSSAVSTKTGGSDVDNAEKAWDASFEPYPTGRRVTGEDVIDSLYADTPAAGDPLAVAAAQYATSISRADFRGTSTISRADFRGTSTISRADSGVARGGSASDRPLVGVSVVGLDWAGLAAETDPDRLGAAAEAAWIAGGCRGGNPRADFPTAPPLPRASADPADPADLDRLEAATLPHATVVEECRASLAACLARESGGAGVSGGADDFAGAADAGCGWAGRVGGCEACGCSCEECRPGKCRCSCVTGAPAPRRPATSASQAARPLPVGLRPDNVGGGLASGGREAPLAPPPPPGAASALEAVTTDTCECAERPGSPRAPGEPCSSDAVVETIAAFVVEVRPSAAQSPPTTGGEAVRAAAAALNCDSESCVLANPKFREFAASQDAGLDGPALRRELESRFKASGPRNSTDLLSNINIDETLQRWAETFPDFYNYPFSMIDFADTGDGLGSATPAAALRGEASQLVGAPPRKVRRKCRTFGGVINSDVSTGRGKHWMGIFGNCSGGRGDRWWIAFFNSAGNPPPREITRWMEEAAAGLVELRRGDGPVDTYSLTRVRHQDSETECGLYSLYFIRRCLDGGGPADFEKGRISDDEMTEFRKHIFRSKK